MTEHEMLREITQEPDPRQVFHRENITEWNVQMYCEAMGMDFWYEDDDALEEQQ
jgi:hypothetical protein